MAMKYVTISLNDANTGEVICETNTCAVGSSSYLRTKITKNVDSFMNYYRDHSDRDLCLQVLVREERSSLSIPFLPDVY